MELIILGSSAAIPVNNRNLSSIALTYHSDIILFDCGEDLQRRFNETGLKFNKSLIILISHLKRMWWVWNKEYQWMMRLRLSLKILRLL